MLKYLTPVLFILFSINSFSQVEGDIIEISEPCGDDFGYFTFEGMNVNWENLDVYIHFKNIKTGEEKIFIRSSTYEKVDWPEGEDYTFYLAEYDQEQGYVTYLNNNELIGNKYKIWYTDTLITIPCDGINSDSSPCPTSFGVICEIELVE